MADKLLKKRAEEHIGLANALLADEKLQGLVEDAAQRIIACSRTCVNSRTLPGQA